MMQRSKGFDIVLVWHSDRFAPVDEGLVLKVQAIDRCDEFAFDQVCCGKNMIKI